MIISILFDTPYNIPSPEPFYAGSYTELQFKLENPFSNQIVDLTNCSDIIFSMTLLGNYNNDIVLKISKRFIGSDNLQRIFIDDIDPSIMTVKLYPNDTSDFEDSWYDFQIKLMSVSDLENSTVGQGKIRAFKQIIN